MASGTKRWWIGSVALAALLTGCPQPCDSAGLQARLDRAMPGDVVEIGSCTYEGSFVVPHGITLRGAGRDRTVLRLASDGAIALSVGSSASNTETVIEHLQVISNGCAAVVARGQGAVVLNDVLLRADRGIGLGAEGLERISLESVSVEGALADGSLPDVVPLPPYTCDGTGPATHGIVMVDVPNATLRDVSSQGFAAFGALFIRTSVDWEGGHVNDHIGAGLEVFGGRARLSQLEICRSRQATAPIESFNALFAGGAQIESEGLVVCDGDAFGLMHDHAVAHHVDLIARNNGFAGIWVQDADSFSLRGTGTELVGNGFAGISALRVTNLEVDGATVRDTAMGTSIMGIGRIEAADGIHLVENGTVALSNLRLIQNARVGLLLDLAGASTETAALSNILADGIGEQFGALAQNGAIVPGWDDGIMRAGSAALNDLRFSGNLEIAGILGPSCLPYTSNVDMGGLNDLIGE